MKQFKTNIAIIKSSQKGLLVTALLITQFGFAQIKPDPNYKGAIGKTLADSKVYWPDPVKGPEGAPHVVWVLLYDVGYVAT